MLWWKDSRQAMISLIVERGWKMKGQSSVKHHFHRRYTNAQTHEHTLSTGTTESPSDGRFKAQVRVSQSASFTLTMAGSHSARITPSATVTSLTRALFQKGSLPCLVDGSTRTGATAIVIVSLPFTQWQLASLSPVPLPITPLQ